MIVLWYISGETEFMRQRPYENLRVWQEAHTLCVWIYQRTKEFPKDERFGLISQMRRSSYSIPMNLAEGNGRRSKKEKVHFIDICIGSLEELHYQCRLSHDLGYFSVEELQKADDHIQRIGYLLSRLRTSLL